MIGPYFYGMTLDVIGVQLQFSPKNKIMITTTEEIAIESTSTPTTDQQNGAQVSEPARTDTSKPAVQIANQNSKIKNSDPALLDDLATLLPRFVVLPKHAAEALALWTVHSHAFKLRDVSVYIGIESP